MCDPHLQILHCFTAETFPVLTKQEAQLAGGLAISCVAPEKVVKVTVTMSLSQSLEAYTGRVGLGSNGIPNGFSQIQIEIDTDIQELENKANNKTGGGSGNVKSQRNRELNGSYGENAAL